MNKCFDLIDEMKDKYVKFLVDVCEIESPTLYKEGVDKVGKYFIDKALELGWDVEVAPQKVSGDAVCITMNKDSKKNPICISGHMDTIHPLGAFGNPTVKIEGDVIKAPGVSDCKGGIVGGFMAMEALQKAGYKDRPVKLILQSDEENSSSSSNKETIKFMCEKCKGADAFINLEPSECSGNARIIYMERKGIVRYEITVHGAAGHSCGCYRPGVVNAITEATYKIQELEKFKDPDAVTCNVGIIKGGSAPNTVADTCMFTADARFVDLEQLKIIEDKIKEVCEKSYLKGTTCEYKKVSYRSPLPYSERNYKLYEKMNEIFASAGLDTLAYTKSSGGTDAAYVSEIGVPTLDSLGIYSALCHSLNEYALISGLVLCAKRLAVLIEKL